ncbi:MAG: hypothetical protein K2R93_15795 [Gemmatimonadaceae bacterium]|nr:hypothetical protein [Gemmatimonadaceae bacterium]
MRAKTLTLTVLLASGLPHLSAAQTVTPKFAWPAGATATVVNEVRTTVSGAAAGMSMNDSSVTRTTSTLAVRAHPEGLEITQSRGVVEKLVASRQPQETDPTAIAAMGGQYIVSRDGQFVRLSNVAEMKRLMDSLMAPTMDRIRQMAPGMVATLEQMSSPAAIERLTANAHRDNYLSMYGRSWTPGDSVITATSMPSPLNPASSISIPRVVRFDGVVPCADPTRRVCWQFSTRTTISRETLRPSLLEMLKQMGMSESMVDQMPIPETNSVALSQVDAATMLPLRLELRTTGGGTGGPVSVLTASSNITTYTWK